MAIFTGSSTTALFNNIQFSAVENDMDAGLFSGHLQVQMASLSNCGIGSEKKSDGAYSDDLAAIKEKGLVSYIMELHEDKIREEILASMGLTEKDLAKMSPEQRASIEKLIAEEIQKRLAAEALLQDGDDKNTKNDQRADKSQLEEIMFGMNSVSPFKIEETKEEVKER
ncbi:MAG: hypothetical protein GY857_13720 [Desulfobacula sp.]|nr:hypothetical protein [Desulfobacula sp.]